jgi:hypothetical protein
MLLPDLRHPVTPSPAAILGAGISLSHLSSFRGPAQTAIDNTVFISPKGNARHRPGLKVAIDPPNSVSPHGKNASISFDGATVGEPIPRPLYGQVMQFIELHHDVLVDYWEYRILTDELQGRLRAIE